MDKRQKKAAIENIKNRLENAGLYIVTFDDIDRLSEGAVDAYENYPLHNWICGGTYNPFVSKLLMQTSIKSMINEGIIYADSPQLKGFVVCIPPRFSGNKVLPFLFNGGLKLLLNFGFGVIKKLLIYDDFAMSLKKKYTNHNDWYLFNLSVSKNAQNQGIASKLLKPLLNLLGEEQCVCYLETNKDSNVSLYEHFGFELLEQSKIPKSDVNHYVMIKK